MNCQAFTNDSLIMMYEAIRGAMAADDALKRQGLAIRFRVRETAPLWAPTRLCRTVLAETDPGRLSRPGLMPFRSVDPDAFVGVNAQLN